MTTTESAIYNRLSTLCHAYVKFFHPEVLTKLSLKAQSDYESRRSRQNSLLDINEALNGTVSTPIRQSRNHWGDVEISEG